MTPGPAVVIGVGNEFRHDDGAGPAVVSALAGLTADAACADPPAVPDGVRLAVCDGEPTRLIDLWCDARLAIVVDAAAGDAAAGLTPGDVVRWDSESAAPGTSAVRVEAAGSHSLGPGAAVALAQVLDRMPGRLVVFAVVGGDFEPGVGLSRPVAAAVSRVAGRIAGELRREGLSARSVRDLGP